MTGPTFQNKEICFGKYAIKDSKRIGLLFSLRLLNQYNVTLEYSYMRICTFVLA